MLTLWTHAHTHLSQALLSCAASCLISTIKQREKQWRGPMCGGKRGTSQHAPDRVSEPFAGVPICCHFHMCTEANRGYRSHPFELSSFVTNATLFSPLTVPFSATLCGAFTPCMSISRSLAKPSRGRSLKCWSSVHTGFQTALFICCVSNVF